MWIAAALSMGCDAGARYRVLSFLFDGVPPPAPAVVVDDGAAAKPVASRRVGYRGHGPFESKQCSACHEPGATNALVAPIQELCFRCHDLPLDKKYVHGPLASGGCRVCHDPHGSQYRYLLVSESDTFCFYCHTRQDVDRVAAHSGVEEQCTDCHDAHMSDQQYLLR